MRCHTGGGRDRTAGERAALSVGGGVMAAREDLWAACPRKERGQEAGRVALVGSLGSTWPRTRHGRNPPAAYGARWRSREGKVEQGFVCKF